MSRIESDSPAELSALRLGDILIELDDEAPSDRFPPTLGSDADCLAKVREYVATRDNLHLVVVHESQYARLKAEDTDLLKNYIFNCEDIVVVNLKTKAQGGSAPSSQSHSIE